MLKLTISLLSTNSSFSKDSSLSSSVMKTNDDDYVVIALKI